MPKIYDIISARDDYWFGGGQILIVVDGEGWYQEEGKEPRSLKVGDVVTIPANIKHWHGAKANTWFSHLAIEQRMERNGVIKREIDSNDTRTKKILLTDKSKKFFEAGRNRMKDLENIAIKNITNEELQIFSNVIDKMIENMNKEE